MNPITIHTDGSCETQTRLGGWAAVLQCGEHQRAIQGSTSDTTVNAMELTAVFMKVPEGYVAFIEELPGANTQGKTLEEARENLRGAGCKPCDDGAAISNALAARFYGKEVITPFT